MPRSSRWSARPTRTNTVAPEEFCVVCGRTGLALTDGVCAECAADRTVLLTLPERGELVVCPSCGARRVGGRWDRPGSPLVPTEEDLAPFLRVHPEVGVRSVRWEETTSTATVRELVAHASVRFRGIEREVALRFSVRLLSQSCPECSRRSGRYYTAVVQLRGPADGRGERPRELRARLERLWSGVLEEARPDVRAAVSWREERPEGWDYYLVETVPARALARIAKQRFAATLKESATLAGRKDGHDVYRVTVCVRFPRAAPTERPGASRGPPRTIALRSAPPLARSGVRGEPP
jgi:nonsense-mediated mRNA decay protein 3